VITDSAQLASLIEQIKSADRVAVDTEADSLHSYREKLCLLQISVPAPASTASSVDAGLYMAQGHEPEAGLVAQQGFRDHSTRKGLRRDYEKLNLAQAAGWKVFQFTPKQLASVETIEWLRVQLSRVE
jgi:hypothetical protein